MSSTTAAAATLSRPRTARSTARRDRLRRRRQRELRGQRAAAGKTLTITPPLLGSGFEYYHGS
jgi:hypothetical protein